MVGGVHLAATVVAPAPRHRIGGYGRVSIQNGSDGGALAEGIDGVVEGTRNPHAPDRYFVDFGFEDVAGGFPGVGDGVDGTGATSDRMD